MARRTFDRGNGLGATLFPEPRVHLLLPLVGGASLLATALLAPPHLLLAVFSVVALAAAAIIATAACLRASAGLRDVAGALALIGFAAAMLAEPDHVVGVLSLAAGAH